MINSKIKDYIIMDCVGFTATAVICSLLCYVPNLKIEITGSVFYLQVFICTTLICAVQYFVVQSPVKSQIAANLITLFVDVIVIFGLGGGVFNWFGWRIKNIILAVGVGGVVFFISSWMMTIRYKELTREINKRIQEREC